MANGDSGSDNWHNIAPVVDEIDSWTNSDLWQDHAFYKMKRCISSALIGLDGLAFFLSKRCGVETAVVSNLIWQRDWDRLRVYFNAMTDEDAKATYMWLHAWNPYV